MKPGTEFEALVALLFGGTAVSDVARTIEVHRNHILPGKTTRHEIDVFWRLNVGVISYDTIIQAKDWKKPVDQGEVLKLKGVLDDLPNQPRGLIVSRVGFQKGALDVAVGNGILLFELETSAPQPLTLSTSSIAHLSIEPRPLTVVVPEGDTATVHTSPAYFVNAHIYTPFDINVKLHAMAPPAPNTSIPKLAPSAFWLQDESGNRFLLSTVIRESLSHGLAEGLSACQETRLFCPPVLLGSDIPEVPSLSVKGVELSFDIEHTESTFPLTPADVVDYLIRSTTHGSTTVVRLGLASKESRPSN